MCAMCHSSAFIFALVRVFVLAAIWKSIPDFAKIPTFRSLYLYSLACRPGFKGYIQKEISKSYKFSIIDISIDKWVYIYVYLSAYKSNILTLFIIQGNRPFIQLYSLYIWLNFGRYVILFLKLSWWSALTWAHWVILSYKTKSCCSLIS